MDEEPIGKEGEKRLEIIQKAAKELGCSFDSVHIFATLDLGEDRGGTENISVGEGSFFLRYGQIKLWILREEAYAQEEAKEN